GSASEGVDVLLGNGDGTFRPRTTYSAPGAGFLGLADLNADSALDLLVTTPNNTISALMGNTDQLGGPYTLTSTDISNGFATVQTGALTEGKTYAINAPITDAAGNQSSASAPFTITEDRTAPSAPAIASVTDDVAPITGQLTSGASTNDPNLAVQVSLSGTG